jgi:hypothetical protein
VNLVRAIELEENTERLDLMDHEQTKAWLTQQIKSAEEDFVNNVDEKRRGRPVEATSTRSIAKVSGVSHEQVHKAQQRVDLGEQFPVFKAAGAV